jgi:hypothetical protein
VTQVLSWGTAVFFVLLGIWLVKIAVGIKMDRRVARKSGNDSIYRHGEKRDDIVDPLSNYDPDKDDSFNPDDVELTIFASDGDVSGSEPGLQKK